MKKTEPNNMNKTASKRKKKKMIVILIVACLLILCGGIYLVKMYLDNHTYDGSGMVNDVRIISLTYSESGDEYGRSTEYVLDDGRLTYRYDGGTTEEESVSKSCIAGEDLEQSLEDIVREYNVRSYKDLPKSDLEILDGSTLSMNIEFADYTIIKLGYYYEMPDDAEKAFSLIIDLLESYIEENGSSSEENDGAPENDSDTDSNGASGNDGDTGSNESSLELLVDYCEKNTATVGGDGYEEYVIYKNTTDDTYQLHFYRWQDGMEEEEHIIYDATEELATEAFARIEELKLIDYQDKEGIGLNGKEYVVKFRQDDKLIRISTDNLGEDGSNMLRSVGIILKEAQY